MKKYLSKKRVCAMLISISMLISAIVMIPIPVEHVSAEDLYSVEESTRYTEPIILSVDYDGEENLLIETTYDNTTDGNTIDNDVSYLDSDDTGDIIDDGDTESNTESDTESNTDNNIESDIENNVSDSTYCELCEEDTCVCERDDDGHCVDCCQDAQSFDECEICDEECEIYGDECDICDEECEIYCEDCELCVKACECGRKDFAMMRNDFLVASGINTYALLNNIVTANINATLAGYFEGNYTSDSIRTAITGGTLVIIEISQTISYNTVISVPTGHNILITSQTNSSNAAYELKTTANIRHFVVNRGATLTLENITLEGNQNSNPNTTHSNTRGGIDVNMGTVILNADAKIINNCVGRTNGTGGGGVALLDRGELIMNEGSVIAYNWMNPTTQGSNRGGGGVYVGKDSTFTMNGGEIEKNFMRMRGRAGITPNYTGVGGGGVYVTHEGTFIMTGGEIKNNEVTPPFGFHNGGGGVFVAAQRDVKGEMQMIDGLITNNYVEHSGDNWQGGGGILTAGTVTMDDGIIDNNRTDMQGGGVYVAPDGFFHMYKGEITNNKAFYTNIHSGGGVIIAGGTFITANHDDNDPGEKIIRDNFGSANGGAFVVRKRHINHYNAAGVLTIADGTVITGNSANPNPTGNLESGAGGAIFLSGEGTLNLFGGEVYDNIGSNSKGITMVNGTINLRGSPKVGHITENNTALDYIHRDIVDTTLNYVMNIQAPLGDDTHINVRDHATDKARPSTPEDQLTVIARRIDGVNATNTDASYFHYMGTKNTIREGWSIIPREHEKDRDLILGPTPPPAKFALLRVPDTIHFGERPLLTTNLVGPYGDVDKASDVQKDFDKGMQNWQYGFEIANTMHDNWTLTLQALPFTNTTGIIGANPIAVGKDTNNPITMEIITTPLRVITRRNEKGESIKWHWTQLDYKIEAQTALNTVVDDDFKSVFTWTLLNAPE